MLLSYYFLVDGNNYLITFCVSFWLNNRWLIENYCTESADTLWVTCVPTWKSRLVYWPAWACSSVPSLDRVLNTRPRYQGVEMVTSFFKSHQRTLLPRKRCGCGITETEGRRQNFRNRELLYLHSACNSLQLWRIGTNVGKKKKTTVEMAGRCWHAHRGLLLNEWRSISCHYYTRHVSGLFIRENKFKHGTWSSLASVNCPLINETLV